MSSQSAATLARLKVEYGNLWRIVRLTGDDGELFVAAERAEPYRTIETDTLTDFETRLRQARQGRVNLAADG
jgi:hypothetical protein